MVVCVNIFLKIVFSTCISEMMVGCWHMMDFVRSKILTQTFLETSGRGVFPVTKSENSIVFEQN